MEAGCDVRVIEMKLLPTDLVEPMIVRIQQWLTGEAVQLSNLSAYTDLSVFELVDDKHKGLLQTIRDEIVQPPQARHQ